jgi:hypothetical protein
MSLPEITSMNRILIVLHLLVLTSLWSCHHHERPERESVLKTSKKQLQVSGRQVLSFTLPDEFQKNEPLISELPKGNAELLKDDAGNWILRFQSKDGIPGTDHLSIDSEYGEGEDHPHCGGGLNPRPFFGQPPAKTPGLKNNRYRLQVEISILKEESNPVEKAGFAGELFR